MKKAVRAIGTMDFEVDIANEINDLGYQFSLVLRDPGSGATSYYTNVRSRALGKELIAKAIEGQLQATSQDENPEDESSSDDRSLAP